MSDLSNRLRDELTMTVSLVARDRHLAAMRAARTTVAATPAFAAEPTRSVLGNRIAAGAAVFTLVAAPTAAMAQNAMPGDSLHGLKVALEHIQGLVDHDIAAQHRLEELEALVADEATTDGELEGALARATEALADSNASQTALDRIAELRDRVDARTEDGRPGAGADPDDARPEDAGAPSEHGRPTDAPGNAPEDAGRPTDTPRADGEPDDATDDDDDDDDGGRPEDAGRSDDAGRPTDVPVPSRD